MVKMVMRCAKELAPSIIYISECEKVCALLQPAPQNQAVVPQCTNVSAAVT